MRRTPAALALTVAASAQDYDLVVRSGDRIDGTVSRDKSSSVRSAPNAFRTLLDTKATLWKLADFVILDRDVLRVEVARLVR